MKTWFFLGLVIVGLLWYGLNNYYTEQRNKQSAPVRYAEGLKQDEKKAEDAAAKAQAVVEQRMKDYQKGN